MLQREGQVAQRVALAQTVTGLTPQRQRPLAGVDGVLQPVEQHQLVGKPVIQPGGHSRVGFGGEPQGPLELRGRLPVRGQLGRPARGARRIAQHRRPVARGLGVKRHPGVVVTSQRTKSSQDPGVDGAAAVRRDRLFHREPRDLMAEPQPPAILGEQPGREDLIDGRRRARRDRLQQVQLDAGADQRRHVQHLTGAAAQPRGARQHRVARRRRAPRPVPPAPPR